MATCGYLCPKCEGNGFLEDGKDCDWCSNGSELKVDKTQDLLEWIEKVHQGPCCSDVENNEEKGQI